MNIPHFDKRAKFQTEELPDLGPPVEVFRRMLSGPMPFLLESSLIEPGGRGRYTFMGSRPFLTLSSRGSRVRLSSGGKSRHFRADPFSTLQKLLQGLRVKNPASDIPFPGGAVGYFSYDLCRFLEKLPRPARDDLKLPDLHLGFYDQVLAYDHWQKRWTLSFLDRRGIKLSQDKNSFLRQLTKPPAPCPRPPAPQARPRLVSNFTRREYLAAVRKIIGYIREGEVYQVNLSQRFSLPLSSPPFSLYRKLRERNPSSFGGYLDFPGLTVVCSSPERFLRLEGEKVETCPIKGTRRRGRNPAEDARLRRELRESPKDRAELNMIVDLERNDLGRVCRYGTVRVKEHARLETHPTVFHLVSTVEGRLRKDLDVVDLLHAAFPGGSITGAPKIRAMEIIAELEPQARSLYTGSLGYIGFDGRTDLNIVIRTILIRNGTAHFHVGGGIVADSDPEAEYEETLVKGRALKEALTE
ncbi:MAG: aminodeoxychorismate synthase component I [bacterium]|nr:aminodeoxychorismate synthase component I [bacterium]